MKIRKLKGKLLCHYLSHAERGDDEAQKKADYLAQQIFCSEEQEENYLITVRFPTGKSTDYTSFEEVVNRFRLTPAELEGFLESEKLDCYGRKFQLKIIL
ncbi:hypothetical protein ACYSNR_10830 [Enterococcus sp. LJL128]